MHSKLQVETAEDANWDYFIDLPDYDRRELNITNVKGSQFLRTII